MKINKSFRKITGIYKIINLVNDKCYVGSAVDLYQRACTYRHLFKEKKLHNNHLQSSMQKYGIENFSFEVLETCDNSISLEELHKIEQSHINQLIPVYNKRFLVDTNSLVQHSEQTKKKISETLKKSFIEGKRKVNRIQSHNIKVSLFDLQGNFVNDFPGLAQCAEFVGVKYQSLKFSLQSERHIVKKYIVLKTEESHKINQFVGIPKKDTYTKKVKLLDTLTNKIFEFNNCKNCSVYIKCKASTIKTCFEKNRFIHGRYKVLEYGY